MVRIFTTSFIFNHERYNAMITVIPQPKEHLITVKILGQELDHFLPNGEVTYHGEEGFNQHELQNHPVSRTLLKRIDEAVRQHLVIPKP
jgi:hypothetical protein